MPVAVPRRRRAGRRARTGSAARPAGGVAGTGQSALVASSCSSGFPVPPAPPCPCHVIGPSLTAAFAGRRDRTPPVDGGTDPRAIPRPAMIPGMRSILDPLLRSLAASTHRAAERGDQARHARVPRLQHRRDGELDGDPRVCVRRDRPGIGRDRRGRPAAAERVHRPAAREHRRSLSARERPPRLVRAPGGRVGVDRCRHPGRCAAGRRLLPLVPRDPRADADSADLLVAPPGARPDPQRAHGGKRPELDRGRAGGVPRPGHRRPRARIRQSCVHVPRRGGDHARRRSTPRGHRRPPGRSPAGGGRSWRMARRSGCATSLPGCARSLAIRISPS